MLSICLYMYIKHTWQTTNQLLLYIDWDGCHIAWLQICPMTTHIDDVDFYAHHNLFSKGTLICISTWQTLMWQHTFICLTYYLVNSNRKKKRGIFVYNKERKKKTFFYIDKRISKIIIHNMHTYIREKKMLMLNDKQIIRLTKSTGTVLVVIVDRHV
jgi:hypothetical protein